MQITKVIALLIFSVSIAKAQVPWRHYTFQNTSGIKSNSVRAITEDGYGNIWFATENGVFEKESNADHWNQFTTDNGLPSVMVNGIHVLVNANRVVAATDNGVSKLSNSTFTNLGGGSEIGWPITMDISGSTLGNYWVVTYGGGIKHWVSGSLISYSTETGLPTNYYRCSFKDSFGNLWFGSSNHGIVKYDGTDWTVFNTQDGLAGNTIIDIIEDNDQTIWAAGDGGLSRIVAGQWESITTDQGLNSTDFFSLSMGENGAVWAGGENGIDVLVNGLQNQHITIADGLSSNYISAIHHSANGDIWIGHPSSGLSAQIDGVWEDQSILRGLGANNILSSTSDNSGRVYFGHLKGVSEFFAEQWNNTGENIGFISNVTEILKDNNQTIWADYRYGYAHLEGDNWIHEEKPIPQGVSNFMTVASNNVKWYSTSNGVYRELDNGDVTNFPSNEYLSNGSPRQIKEADNGQIWTITNRGFSMYNGNSWKNYPVESGYSAASRFTFNQYGNPISARTFSIFTPSGSQEYYTAIFIFKDEEYRVFSSYAWPTNSSRGTPTSIFLDSENSIWVGLSNWSGQTKCLRFLPSGSVQAYGNNVGITNSVVSSICEDAENVMWFSTNSGVYSSPLSEITSIEELDQPAGTTQSLFMFPNPSLDGAVTLKLQSSSLSETLVIHDVFGNLVHQERIALFPNAINSIKLDLSFLSSGIYIVKTKRSKIQPLKLIYNK